MGRARGGLGGDYCETKKSDAEGACTLSDFTLQEGVMKLAFS